MANKAQISWVEFQIPEASSNTYAKSGGIESAGSEGGVKIVSYAKSGGIQSAGSLGGAETKQVIRAGGQSSAGSVGGSGDAAFSKAGGIEASGVLSGSQAQAISRAGGTASAAQIGAQRATQASKDGGTTSVSTLGGSGFGARISGITSTGSMGGTGWALILYAKTGGIISSGDPLANEVTYFTKRGGFETGTAAIGPGFVPAPFPTGGGEIVGRRRRSSAGRVVTPVARIRKKRLTKKQRIEAHAESILKRKTLPEHFSVGAQKAYQQMQQFYGTLEGRRIFIKKALEQGHGDTLLEKVNDVYATGTTVDQTTKVKTQVRMTRAGPSVKILSKFK